MKRKKLILNLSSSLLNQVVSILCAFILPRLILSTYGSEVNGLVSSITQFLAVVSFSEFGVTAVVQSSLYKPLAEKDEDEISKIVVSARKFYRWIATVLIIYVIVLCFIYPMITDSEFSRLYIVCMVMVLSINSLAQYLLGITKTQLLSADQRNYITSFTSTGVNILNTVVCTLLILGGSGIHMVKLTTAIIFLLKPAVYTVYVRRHYNINYKIKYEGEPIKQKWNGFAQHIAYYVLNNTDTIVLTIFSTLQNVSVYAVYILVLNGVNQLLNIFENAVKPLMGEYWARGEKEKFNHNFSIYEWTLHTLACVIYGCVAALLVPFVQVYTNGVTDANYYVPVFALIMTMAFAMQCIRNPYNTIIMSVGHYKQTQWNYIAVALTNIIISIVMVKKFGLVGVAIGTVVAMTFQVLWQSHYLYKNVLEIPIGRFVKLFITDLLTLAVCIGVGQIFSLGSVTYLGWIWLAVKVFVVVVIITAVVNLVFWRKQTALSIKTILRR